MVNQERVRLGERPVASSWLWRLVDGRPVGERDEGGMVLPAPEKEGAGRGRGGGREPGVWSAAAQERAVRIVRLRHAGLTHKAEWRLFLCLVDVARDSGAVIFPSPKRVTKDIAIAYRYWLGRTRDNMRAESLERLGRVDAGPRPVDREAVQRHLLRHRVPAEVRPLFAHAVVSGLAASESSLGDGFLQAREFNATACALEAVNPQAVDRALRVLAGQRDLFAEVFAEAAARVCLPLAPEATRAMLSQQAPDLSTADLLEVALLGRPATPAPRWWTARMWTVLLSAVAVACVLSLEGSAPKAGSAVGPGAWTETDPHA